METTVTGHRHKRLDEMEHGYGGVFVRARAELGVTAFGMQVIELPPDSGDFYPEHDHIHDGQEEVYVLLRGSASMTLPDGTVTLDPETFVALAPDVRRRVRSGPDGARLLVVSGVPGAAYTPSPNSELGAAETFAPTASTAMLPDGPPPQLDG